MSRTRPVLHDACAMLARDAKGRKLRREQFLCCGAELVVVDRTRQRWGITLLDRSEDVKLLRRCRLPLLFVGTESKAAYRRVLVAVDFSDASGHAARIALAMSPNASFTFVHAVRLGDENLMHEFELSRDLIRRFRKKACEAGREKLREFVTSLGVNLQGVALVAEHGAAERVIAACSRRMQADLIVVGKRPRSWLQDLFAGSLALHLLRASPADLLVTPVPCRDGTGADEQ